MARSCPLASSLAAEKLRCVESLTMEPHPPGGSRAGDRRAAVLRALSSHVVPRTCMFVCALFCALAWAPSQGMAKEPWLLDLEAAVGTPLTKPQSRWYGVGGSLAISVQKPLVSWLALTA